ncbi:hypothetical protein COHA_000277 [Chlorella ohadii]|uniref:Uncharacterized protein n=1 Tax=Chlorella ohadii TaxID=2649997 RepID=A0AAD5DYZ6_9CHLO|nr:hypothetical protein COHA_000277 [Chlorella ohadii]
MPPGQAVPFRAPDSLAVTVQLPNRGTVRGLAIRRGVTLICGGGFHGKTTLLKAIEAGVYNKIPGDGRELIATDPTAVKIRAEDGRRVEAVNISPFIANLPFGKDTTNFGTPDASGSTSQAANIQEALEVGAHTLLVDEDTSATNFMIRDARMQELVSGAREPITPFIVKLPALAAQRGVSCVLVIGGSGQYFDVADTVICMDEYLPADVTTQAQAISRRHAGPGDSLPRAERYGDVTPRTLKSGELALERCRMLMLQLMLALLLLLGGCHTPRPGARRAVHSRPLAAHGRDLRVKTRTRSCIQLDQDELDLSAVEQLVEVSQTRAIADALVKLRRLLAGGGGSRGGGGWRGRTLAQVLDALEVEMDEQARSFASHYCLFAAWLEQEMVLAQGLDALSRSKPGNLARPRRFELAAAVNRLRTAQLRQVAS